jgi:hypothetical protein
MPTEAEVYKLAVELFNVWLVADRAITGGWDAVARHVLSQRPLDDIPTPSLARAMWRAAWPEHEFPEEISGVWDKAAERLKAWVTEQRS